MISENEKNKYQSVKAPHELKKRIENDIQKLQTESVNKQSKRSSTMFGSNVSPKFLIPNSSFQIKKIASAIAACILVVFMVGFVGVGMNSAPVYLNGEVFYGEEINLPQPSMVQRASVDGGKVIEIDCRFETKLSAENGEFTLTDRETGEVIYTGNEYSVKGKVLVSVSVPEGEKTVLKLQNILSEREIAFINSSSF